MLDETIDEIRYWHRQRNFAMKQRKRSDLALGSFLRLQLGWNKSLPAADRTRISGNASALVETGEKIIKEASKPEAKRKAVPGADSLQYQEWSGIIEASVAARLPYSAVEVHYTKEMERLARTLPVWESWACEIRGFGPRSLAVIVGEAGDLSLYPKKGHLWKRMGLAVIDGVRQGGLSKSASAESWIEHGYNRARRSSMYVIGDVQVKLGERYRQIYLQRKEYERASARARGLTIAPALKIKKSESKNFISDGVIHLRAQRYMEKRLLKDLWQAWRRTVTCVPDRPVVFCPSPEIEPEHPPTLQPAGAA